MKKAFDGRWLPAIGLLMLSATVSAQPAPQTTCMEVLTNVDNVDVPLTSADIASHPSCFGGSALTAQVQINATSFAQASAISGALGSRFMGSAGPGPQAAAGTRGLAAGGIGKPFNVWGNLSHADTRQDYLATPSLSVSNDAMVLNTVLGADYALAPNFVLGVSAAVDRGDLSSQAAGQDQLQATSKGYVIAPYAGYQLNKVLALDASVGFGQGKLYSSGDVNAESDRWFGAANLSYNQWFGNAQVTGKLSYLHGEEKYGDIRAAGVSYANTGARNTIDQMRLGVQAGYWLSGGFMPYAGLAYVNDLHRSTSLSLASQDPIGKDAWVWTLGLNFFSLASGVTAGIAYNQEEGRSNQKNNNLLANISVRF